MASKKTWFMTLKEAMRSSVLVSNVAFGFILTGLEKIVELEFECPCKPRWNRVFSSAFFVVPGVFAFVVMLFIQKCRCNERWCVPLLSSLISAAVWLILLFLDGQYFTCAMTDWKGRFVHVDKAAPQKWCEPIGVGNVTSHELMLHSQQLFVLSQAIGIGLALIIVLSFAFYLCVSCCQALMVQEAYDSRPVRREARPI